MQTVISNLLILICVVMLTACGLKGPLYLPDEKPVQNPSSTQELETPDAEEPDAEKIEKEEELEGSGKRKPVSN